MSVADQDGAMEAWAERWMLSQRWAGDAVEVGVSTSQHQRRIRSVAATYYSGFMVAPWQIAGQIWALGRTLDLMAKREDRTG